MANIDLRFLDCSTTDNFIQVKKIKPDCFGPEYAIKISGVVEGGQQTFRILLDKSTAIKFAKTLRTEINKITESEVGNG